MQRLTPAHRVAAILLAMLLAVPIVTEGGAAIAAPKKTTKTTCSTQGVCTTVTCVDHVCTVTVTQPGSPGKPGQPGKPSPLPSDDRCAGMVGNDPATADNPAACRAQLHGDVCLHRERLILDSLGVNNINTLTPAQVVLFNQQMAAAGCPTVTTPGTLAQTALNQMTFAPPAFHRSPDETKKINGLPYSWVNLWTFVWTSQASWQPLSKTAATPNGAVWATVTATPTTLTYTPGDGHAPVVCNGPGRPWVDSDGFNAPSQGACAYKYTDYSRHPLTVTLTETWSISWVGSGGTAGTITPPMTASTSGQLNVMQIETVNR
jgi:hypothetical protein